MGIGWQAGIGGAFLLAGLLLARWAARHDVKGWVTDAAWRFVFRRGWRAAASDPASVVDDELKSQIAQKTDAWRADTDRLGHARATAKHGALLALAQVASIVSTPLLLIGALVLAHAAWRWWG